MERVILKSLVALLLFMVLENVIGTVVGPTLIFYIESVGGSNEDYGLTTSSVCVGTALMTFYFGKWVDSNGASIKNHLAPPSSLVLLDRSFTSWLVCCQSDSGESMQSWLGDLSRVWAELEKR